MTYIVQPGDTLSAIAVRFGTTVSALLAANPAITNPNLIFVDQAIQVPTGGAGPTVNPLEDLSGPRGPAEEAFTPSQPPPLPSTSPSTASPSGGTTVPSPSGATTTTPVAPAEQGGGVITFSVQREDGSFVPVPVYIPPNVWSRLLASPLRQKWGLDLLGEDGTAQIGPGLQQLFLNDLQGTLTPEQFSLVSSLVGTSTGAVAGNAPGGTGDFPPLDPRMVQEGIAYTRNPTTGEIQLVDTKPLQGPGLAAWEFVLGDPNDPSAGSWTLVADPSDMENVMSGVPSSVRPWVQAYLDAGGDINVVPPGAAREWVEFVVNRVGREPDELPFGLGTPDFAEGRVGATIPQGPGSVIIGDDGTPTIVPFGQPGTVFPGGTNPTGDDFTFTPSPFTFTPEQAGNIIPGTVQGDQRGLAAESVARAMAEALNQNFGDAAFRFPRETEQLQNIFTPEVINDFAFGGAGVNPVLPNVEGFAEMLAGLQSGGSVGTGSDVLTRSDLSGRFFQGLHDQGLITITPQNNTTGNVNIRFNEPTPNDNIPGVTAPPTTTEDAPAIPNAPRVLVREPEEVSQEELSSFTGGLQSSVGDDAARSFLAGLNPRG